VTVLITTLLFWCMLEVSLGIIACCLPTLRGLIKTRSVDSVVHSIREKISLRSLHSARRSNTSEDSVQLTHIEGTSSYKPLDAITINSNR
jgi:hypothetical protein